MVIFTILILLMHEHGVSVHILVSHFLSLFKDILLSLTTAVNRGVCVISFSICFLVVAEKIYIFVSRLSTLPL